MPLETSLEGTEGGMNTLLPIALLPQRNGMANIGYVYGE